MKFNLFSSFFSQFLFYLVLWLNCYKAPCKRMQHCWPTTLNIVGCNYMLRPFAHPVACCWMLLRVVAQSLKLIKLFSQQLPTFLLFCDCRSVAQQCWIRLHSSSNIVGATHAHYAWFTKTCGLYPSHVALQVLTLLGVVASVCTPLPTRTQQLPTFLAQLCWELLHPFARNPTTNILNLKRQGHAFIASYSNILKYLCCI